MKGKILFKKIALIACAAVFAVSMGLAFFLGFANTSKSTAVAEDLDPLPQEIDTDINAFTGWGEGGVKPKGDPNYVYVYKETTLWDIKTRIAVYANIQRTGFSDASNQLLEANEFNIKLQVGAKTYSDVDIESEEVQGNLKAQPFANFGSDGVTADSVYSVSVTALQGVGYTSSSMLGDGARTVQVKLSNHPEYSATQGFKIELDDSNPYNNPVYTTTQWRNFSKYEFFYKASIKGVLKTFESSPDEHWEEVPRELLTARFNQEGKEQFTLGTDTNNGVSVSYQNSDMSTVQGTIQGDKIYVDTPKVVSVRLELNTPKVETDKDKVNTEQVDGVTTTIYRASATGNTYYRAGLPESFNKGGGVYSDGLYNYTDERGQGDWYGAATSQTYYAFVGEMNNTLLGYALRATVRDSNGTVEVIRCDDSRFTVGYLEGGSERNGQIQGGTFTESMPYIGYNGTKDLFLQVKYTALAGAGGEATASNQVKVNFISRANLYLKTNVKDGSEQVGTVEDIDFPAGVLKDAYPNIKIERVERDGRIYDVTSSDTGYSFAQNQGFAPRTFYKDRTAQNYETGEEQYIKEGDDYYFYTSVAVQNQSGQGANTVSAYVPFKVKYTEADQINIQGTLTTKPTYNSGSPLNLSGVTVSFPGKAGELAYGNSNVPDQNVSYINDKFKQQGFRAWTVSQGGWSQRAIGYYTVVYYTADELKNIKDGKQADGTALDGTYTDGQAEFFNKVTISSSNAVTSKATNSFASSGVPVTGDALNYLINGFKATDRKTLTANTAMVRLIYFVPSKTTDDQYGIAAQTTDLAAYKDFIVGRDLSINRSTAGNITVTTFSDDYGNLTHTAGEGAEFSVSLWSGSYTDYLLGGG